METKEMAQTQEIFNPEADNKIFTDSFEAAPETEEAQPQLPLIETPGAVKETKETKEDLGKTKDPETVDYKKLYEDEQQKTKSWEGRISKAETKAKEFEAKLQEAAKTKETPVLDVKSSVVDVDDPIIQEFIKEMGDDFIKPLEAYVRKQNKVAIEQAFKPYVSKLEKLDLLDKLPELEQRLLLDNESKVVEHFEAIKSAHPDVVTILESGELDGYVEKLSYKEAMEGKRILEKGKTQEVIEFLNKFKESTGKINPSKGNGKDVSSQSIEQKVQPTKVSNEKVLAATAVKGGSFSLPKGKAAADDFVGAFDEAVASDNIK